MVPEFYYAEFSRQFRLWKRERSGGYVTDDKDENGRKGRARKERNYFKTTSYMSLNKVMLIGNVGKDPEVRYLDGNAPGGQGRKVASFTLATSERYKDRSGETRENTEWHNIVVWGQPADVVEKYVKKGTQLYIEGRIRTRSWTDQSGAKKYMTEINADSLQLLGRRDDSQGAGGYQAQRPYPQSQQTTEAAPASASPSPAARSEYNERTGDFNNGFAAPPTASAPAAQRAAADFNDSPADDLPF